MAKAKKQETTDAAAKKSAPANQQSPASAKSAALAKKPAANKKLGKPDKRSVATRAEATPMIDTDLAAQTAAAMVANRAAIGTSQPAGSQKQESSSFKSLKESLNKPSAGGLGGILGTGTGNKKFSPGFGGPKQGGPGAGGGRNQTFGADVNRSGVPRRTGGG
jgi:hypothetical protein